MSAHFLKVFLVIPACLLAALATAQAEEWMRGAVVVTAAEGDVVLEEVGGEPWGLQPEDSLPHYMSGLLKIDARLKGSVFLRTSNRISIYNEGDGFFAIERFEQDVAKSMDQGKSRMILNFRRGFLVVDNRALSDSSQMIVETPVGRISVKNGWWLMRIAYDDRSHIYDVSIECADGVLRFTDQGGGTYTLRNGQRLRGAGASSRLSIEVAEISDEARESFEEFAMMEVGAEAMELSDEALRSKMKSLAHANGATPAAGETSNASGTGKRPLLIEYAPQSAPVTPFRAERRPPSGYQADLF